MQNQIILVIEYLYIFRLLRSANLDEAKYQLSMKLFLCETELHFRIKSFFTVEQWRLQIQMLHTTRHVSCR